MLFAPPKVRALSRYSEFGMYLSRGDFFNMVLIALVIHALIIGAYALMPAQKVVHIPVRVLNIRLNAPDDMGTPPSLTSAPSGSLTNAPVLPQSVLAAKVPPHRKMHRALKLSVPAAVAEGGVKPLRLSVLDDVSTHDAVPVASVEASGLDTPKKYVRMGEDGEEGNGAGTGAGTGTSTGTGAGTGSGREIVRRYEQTISLWIAHHQIYPDDAKQQGLQGDAVVRIRIDRLGHILNSAVDHSSGNNMLDEAALSMVQASNPVPAVPSDYPEGTELEFLIPVSFRLQ